MPDPQHIPPKHIEIGQPGAIFGLGCEVVMQVEAEAASGSSKRTLPTFSILAYTGGAMRGFGRYPIVIDLAGITARHHIPILLDHWHDQIIGQSTDISIAKSEIRVTGKVTGEDEHAQKVEQHARNGFKWGASVGVISEKWELIDEDTSVNVNGQTFNGPLFVMRKGELYEVSFVASGADGNANAALSASTRRGRIMPDSSTKVENVTQGATAESTLPAKTAQSTADPLADLRKRDADEMRRMAAIRAAAGSDQLELAAKAIEEGWDVNRFSAEVKLARVTAQAPAGIVRDNTPKDMRVLECAIRIGSAEPRATIEKAYDPQTLEAASRHRHLGLKATINTALALSGRSPLPFTATADEYLMAAASTLSVAGLLSNTGNKMLLAAYDQFPQVASVVTRKLNTNDFKTHTGYRASWDAELKPMSPGGEIEHGTISDKAFPYKADTRAKLFHITRQDIINDDLGAFTQMPQQLAMGAWLAKESALATLILANAANFMHSSNNNLLTGGTSALSFAGLGLAVAAMEKQYDPTSKSPIPAFPKYLLVPPELSEIADSLFMTQPASGLIATGVGNTAAKSLSSNIYYQRFRPVKSPWLSRTGFHANVSPTAWYLIGDPAMVPAFGVAYLNGNEVPTIQEVAPAPNFLGLAFQAYLDFGVCTLEPQGVVKATGA